MKYRLNLLNPGRSGAQECKPVRSPAVRKLHHWNWWAPAGHGTAGQLWSPGKPWMGGTEMGQLWLGNSVSGEPQPAGRSRPEPSLKPVATELEQSQEVGRAVSWEAGSRGPLWSCKFTHSGLVRSQGCWIRDIPHFQFVECKYMNGKNNR